MPAMERYSCGASINGRPRSRDIGTFAMAEWLTMSPRSLRVRVPPQLDDGRESRREDDRPEYAPRRGAPNERGRATQGVGSGGLFRQAGERGRIGFPFQSGHPIREAVSCGPRA
jgi:hypothetical protein